MRTIKIICLIVTLVMHGATQAQSINWDAPESNNAHRISISLGLEYGTVFTLGYGYQFNIWKFPVEANAHFSVPSGDNMLDDYKCELGGQIRWLNYHDFMFSTNIQGVFRRYASSYVHIVDFGSDLTGVVGYYRPNWYAAAEVGFDKAIASRYNHQQAYYDQYPDVVDGWYEPAQGGNFYYGLQLGGTLKKNDLFLKAGKILEQDFRTEPLLPFYAQIGFARRI